MHFTRSEIQGTGNICSLSTLRFRFSLSTVHRHRPSTLLIVLDHPFLSLVDRGQCADTIRPDVWFWYWYWFGKTIEKQADKFEFEFFTSLSSVI